MTTKPGAVRQVLPADGLGALAERSGDAGRVHGATPVGMHCIGMEGLLGPCEGRSDTGQHRLSPEPEGERAARGAVARPERRRAPECYGAFSAERRGDAGLGLERGVGAVDALHDAMTRSSAEDEAGVTKLGTMTAPCPMRSTISRPDSNKSSGNWIRANWMADGGGANRTSS